MANKEVSSIVLSTKCSVIVLVQGILLVVLMGHVEVGSAA